MAAGVHNSAYITELLFVGMAHDAPGSSHGAGSICVEGGGLQPLKDLLYIKKLTISKT